MTERTLSIVKPDAVAKNAVGAILSACEAAGLRIVASKMVHLTKAQAEGFYAVHRDKPFFEDLTRFMSEGPIVVSVLEGENAIERYRQLLGNTDPAKAEEGTIRRRFGTDIERNAAHGSDGPETAAFEIDYFFNQLEIFSR
ncbi:MAG: nucleoside-diphosphate kinase [Candidatus Dadabacteria bacterium]|nr:MAG: nucleoside-diphosphate kinase [Candidatus Dadabacteria bacterium]